MLSETLSDQPYGAPGTGRDVFGRSSGDYPHVAELFENAARRYANRIAAVEPGFSPLTYGDLERRSSQLAIALVNAGIGRGAFVALCAGRSIRALIAIVAIIRTGAAYVSLDPAYPDGQLAFMLADADPAIVLADPEALARLAGITEGRRPVWLLDGIDAAAHDPGESFLSDRAERHPEDPAYVMYTSGSTGRPKGVLVPHRGISRLVVGQNYCRLGPQEIILHLAPLAFDASTFEIWAALLHGGKLAIVSQERPSLNDIATALTSERVTTAWLPAGLFHLMVDCRLGALAGVDQLLAGGDVLSPDHVGRFLDAVPHCRLINGYGPTENTTFTCCATIDRARWSGGRVPVGNPVAGTQVFIVDQALQPVACGEEGQLATAGAGLALGYLKQDALTRESFVEGPAPISQRIYLTGDLVRALPDGSIDFLGRIDRQLKIDGKRVEPGEIEAALRQCDSVADACIIIDGQAKRILAFIAVTDRGQEKGEIIARSALVELRGRLPVHMLPARIVPMAFFPLTPNGKFDRAAMLEHSSVTEVHAPAVPTDDLQRQILAIWRRALGSHRIGLDEVFFDLGGSSLQWMQVHADVERLLTRRIAIADMFARPTIRLLAEHLGGRTSPTSDNLAEAARDRAQRQRGAAIRRGSQFHKG